MGICDVGFRFRGLEFRVQGFAGSRMSGLGLEGFMRRIIEASLTAPQPKPLSNPDRNLRKLA